MKKDLDNLFSIWDSDSKPIRIENENESYRHFIQSIPFSLEWLLSTSNGLEFQKEKEEILNDCYRKTAQILGFIQIYQIPKLDHLFAILSFIFDEARERATLNIYSFDYLVKLIIERCVKISQDLDEHRESTEDIRIIVEEAILYCKPVIEKSSVDTKTEEKEHSERISSSVESLQDSDGNIELPTQGNPPKAPDLEEGLERPDSNPEVEAVQVDYKQWDEPEALEIPVDKLGLISDFYEESVEHLTKLGNGALELENNPEDSDTINELFRSTHTLKGGARLLNVKKMEKISHITEEVLDRIRKSSLKMDPVIVDLLLESRKRIQSMVDEIASRGPIHTRISDLLEKYQNLLEGRSFSPNPIIDSPVSDGEEIQLQKQSDSDQMSQSIQEEHRKPTEKNSKDTKPTTPTNPKMEKMATKNQEFIRVNTEKLDEVINYSSELSITRIQFENEFSVVNKLLRDWKKTCERIEKHDLSVIYSRLENANKYFIDEFNNNAKSKGEPGLDNQSLKFLKRFQNEIKSEMEAVELSLTEEATLAHISLTEIRNNILKSLENLNLLTSRLQSGVMNFRMVPIASLFERFPTLVRDLARQCNKSVTVKTEGGDTELDRTIINHLADPMIHLLRNSIDHGIEEPEERIELEKPKSGTILLRAFYQGSFAVIEIRDDGRGIDRKRIIRKAIENGLYSEEEMKQMSDPEIFALIFHPGFSTKDEVSELSGRGVGMDVVKSSVKSLQGEIEIHSKLGKGTSIFLRLPLTLAVVRVLLFDISSHVFAFPMANISEIIAINKSSLETIGDRLLFRWSGEYIPVVKLSSILEIPGVVYTDEEIDLIILEEGGRKIALMVDKLFGRQEIVIKNLGSILKKVPFVMGCTILSDRRIVLVLNPKEILDDGLMVSSSPQNQLIQSLKHAKKNILIVDDSSIHRQQLKTVLLREGYNVDEAENGFEALKMVRLKSYSVLCVDIVMPLMDGFELTRRLRNLPLYRTIPVFLITSSTTKEDRDRGFKIGANEFFEKPIEPDSIIEKLKAYVEEEESK